MWDWLPDNGGAMRVVADEYVTAEDGTGLVHLAYYGEDDFRILRKNGVPLVLSVGSDGLVADNVTPFAGRWFREDGLDVDILKALKAKNLLIGKEKYTHAYPFDYRTGMPLMYFPRPAWFIRTTALKDMMLEANRLIGWKPEHIREGRFGNWLENVTDWNVTRERFWGSPLPVWQTEDGSESVCVSSLSELRALVQKSGGKLPDNFDAHKPEIDQIVLRAADGPRNAPRELRARQLVQRRHHALGPVRLSRRTRFGPSSSARSTRRTSSAKVSTRPAAGSTPCSPALASSPKRNLKRRSVTAIPLT